MVFSARDANRRHQLNTHADLALVRPGQHDYQFNRDAESSERSALADALRSEDSASRLNWPWLLCGVPYVQLAKQRRRVLGAALIMILGSHVIFGAYGFWLPNDPQGSWSDFVGSWELFRYGHATKRAEPVSLAPREHDRALRSAAKEALKYPAVEFNDFQIEAIAAAFAWYSERSGLLIWACAIMPDHVHLVLGRHRLTVEKLVIQLKGDATQTLIERKIHPLQAYAAAALRSEDSASRLNGAEPSERTTTSVRPPKCFARGEWKVYLDSVDNIYRAIEYVEGNPGKEGRPAQKWPFVVVPQV